MNQRTPLSEAPEEQPAPQGQRVVRAVLVKNKRRLPRPPEPQEEVDTRSPVAPLTGRQRVGRLARVFSLLLVFGSLALGFCYLVSVRLQVVKAGIALALASREQDELLQKNRELRVEKASLRSPAKIAEQASKDLKMSVPDPKRVIVLDHQGEEIPDLAPPTPEPQESFGGHLVQ